MQDDDFDPAPPQPESWTDLRAIVRDEHDVSIERIRAGVIVREYDFKEFGPCGRASCHKQHKHGALVALRGGGFINIGHCCARIYLGEHWQQMVSVFNARTRAEARDAAVRLARRAALQKQELLDALLPEARRLTSLLQSFRAGLTPRLATEFERRAEKGDSRLEGVRALSQSEIEARQIALEGHRQEDKQARYVAAMEHFTIGEIKGLYCLRVGRSPVDAHEALQSLVRALRRPLSDEASDEAIRDLQNDTRELGPISNRFNQSLTSARDFFSDANLRLLMRWPMMKSQGILAIAIGPDATIQFTRAPGWERKTAA